MNNYKSTGEVVTVTAPYALDSGDGCKVGALFGVASNDYESGDTAAEIKTTGTFELVKDTGTAWTLGDKVYWDDSAKECDTDSAAGILIGVAAADAGSSDVLGIVRLNGTVTDLSEGAQAAEAALVDNSGGATADGTIGVITLWTALTDNGGGTADGTVSTMPDIALSTAGGNTYTDAAVNTAVNALALTIRNNMKEVTTTLATDRTAMVAVADAVKELSTKINAVIAKLVLAGILDA